MKEQTVENLIILKGSKRGSNVCCCLVISPSVGQQRRCFVPAFPPLGEPTFAIETSPTHTFVQGCVPNDSAWVLFFSLYSQLPCNLQQHLSIPWSGSYISVGLLVSLSVVLMLSPDRLSSKFLP